MFILTARLNDYYSLLISYIFIDVPRWVISDVSFGFKGGFGSCNIRPLHPNDPVGIDLTPTPIPTANLRIHTRQMTWLYPWVSLLILQQLIRAKLLWWLLSLSFKNQVATLFLLSGRDDVIIRLFVQSGM